MHGVAQIKNKPIKWGTAITLFVTAGFGLPVFAVHYSNSKMAG
jgi:hypothetical protein